MTGSPPTDRPITERGPMVRALIEGRRAQLRLPLRPQPNCRCAGFQFVGTDAVTERPCFEALDRSGKPIYAFRAGKGFISPYAPVPFAVGDRLWVRETCSAAVTHDAYNAVRYEADQVWRVIPDTASSAERWRDLFAYGRRRGATVPSIHMPRWASRITLVVTNIRIERVQGISADDAAAEGLWSYRYQDCDGEPRLDGRPFWQTFWHWRKDIEEGDGYGSPQAAYRALWDALHGNRSPWERNDWVVALTYTVHPCNIDEMPMAEGTEIQGTRANG